MLCFTLPLLLSLATLFSSHMLFQMYREVSKNAVLVVQDNSTNTSLPSTFFFPSGKCDKPDMMHVKMNCLKKGSSQCKSSNHAEQTTCISQRGTIPSCKCGGPLWDIRYSYAIDFEQMRPYVQFTMSGPISIDGCQTRRGVRELRCFKLPCSFRIDDYKESPGKTTYYEYLEFGGSSTRKPSLLLIGFLGFLVFLY